MGINEDPPNGESKGDVWRTCYSKSAGPRSPSAPGPRRPPVPVACVLAQTPRRAEEWGRSTVGTGGAPGVPRLWAVGWGSCGQADWKGGTLWSGEHIRLCLAGLRLEEKTQINEAANY